MGGPATTGVFYDDTFNHGLFPAGTTNCTGAAPGAEVSYTEALDRSQHPITLDAGQDPNADALTNLPTKTLQQTLNNSAAITRAILKMTPTPQTLIDPSALPVSKAGCAPFYPHPYLRVNMVFGVMKAAGMRTAWSDKHPAYEILSGPSGHGIDDLFTPEISSVADARRRVGAASRPQKASPTHPRSSSREASIKLLSVTRTVSLGTWEARGELVGLAAAGLAGDLPTGGRDTRPDDPDRAQRRTVPPLRACSPGPRALPARRRLRALRLPRVRASPTASCSIAAALRAGPAPGVAAGAASHAELNHVRHSPRRPPGSPPARFTDGLVAHRGLVAAVGHEGGGRGRRPSRWQAAAARHPPAT